MKPPTVKCDRCNRDDVTLQDAVFVAEFIGGNPAFKPGEICVCQECLDKGKQDADLLCGNTTGSASTDTGYQ